MKTVGRSVLCWFTLVLLMGPPEFNGQTNGEHVPELALVMSQIENPFSMQFSRSAGTTESEAPRCHCRAAFYQGTAMKALNSYQIDLGILRDFNTLLGNATDNHEEECQDLCSQAAENHPNYNDANWWCNKAGAGGKKRIVAYSKVGVRDWTIADNEYIDCCATGGQVSCPAGSTYDGNGPGNKKCKKTVCNLAGATSLPPNNYKIGDWGFIWGNAIIQWISGSSTPLVVKSCDSVSTSSGSSTGPQKNWKTLSGVITRERPNSFFGPRPSDPVTVTMEGSGLHPRGLGMGRIPPGMEAVDRAKIELKAVTGGPDDIMGNGTDHTGHDGTFRFTLLPGTYEVIFTVGSGSSQKTFKKEVILPEVGPMPSYRFRE